MGTLDSVVVSLSEGGVSVRARDWPLAPSIGWALLVPSCGVLLWSIPGRHLIEAGGAIVFVGIGAFALFLGARDRRDLVVRRSPSGISVTGSTGALAWRRQAATSLDAAASVMVRDLPGAVDGGAGADLVLVGNAGEVHLARGVGPAGRREMESAASAIRSGLSI